MVAAMATYVLLSGRWFRTSAALFVFLLTLATGRAQTNPWAYLFEETSYWYVPNQNLLSYLTSTSDLTDNVMASDQTLWTIAPSTNGTISGTSVAAIESGMLVMSSTSTMTGLVTETGQVRIAFSAPDSPTTIGIGQVREIEGETYLQMQMMTGTSLYVTHWAYMATYNGLAIPPFSNAPELLSPEWSWMEGTTWALESDELFGEGNSGQFQIEAYLNGYFWGRGTGPEGSEAENFTLIGSATPEGNILFNLLSGTTLTNLSGMISGGVETGSMVLRSYDSPETFTTAGAQVVPEPGVMGLLLAAGGLAGVLGWRRFCCG